MDSSILLLSLMEVVTSDAARTISFDFGKTLGIFRLPCLSDDQLHLWLMWICLQGWQHLIHHLNSSKGFSTILAQGSKVVPWMHLAKPHLQHGKLGSSGNQSRWVKHADSCVYTKRPADSASFESS